MTNAKLKQAIQNIKKLISDSDLDRAVAQLELLSHQLDIEEQHRVIKISANWSDLDKKIDQMLINEQTALVRQNQMISEILEFLKDVERPKGGNLPKPTPRPTPKSSKAKWYILGLLFLGIIGFGVYQFTQPEPPVQETAPANKDCLLNQEKAIKFFSKKKYAAAEQLLNKILMTCPEKEVAADYLERIETLKQQRDEDNNPPDTEPKKPPVINPNILNPNVTTIIREADLQTDRTITIPENLTIDRIDATPPAGNYNQLMREGEAAFNDGKFEEAYLKYKAAQAVEDTIEAGRKMNEALEKVYRKYFSKGMDYYNVKAYNKAKVQFEKARSFKDILQVRSMIKRCERYL